MIKILSRLTGRGTISLDYWGLQLPQYRFRSELITLAFLVVFLNHQIHSVLSRLPSHNFQISWNTLNYLFLNVILCKFMLYLLSFYTKNVSVFHKLCKLRCICYLRLHYFFLRCIYPPNLISLVQS